MWHPVRSDGSRNGLRSTAWHLEILLGLAQGRICILKEKRNHELSNLPTLDFKKRTLQIETSLIATVCETRLPEIVSRRLGGGGCNEANSDDGTYYSSNGLFFTAWHHDILLSLEQVRICWTPKVERSNESKNYM